MSRRDEDDDDHDDSRNVTARYQRVIIRFGSLPLSAAANRLRRPVTSVTSRRRTSNKILSYPTAEDNDNVVWVGQQTAAAAAAAAMCVA